MNRSFLARSLHKWFGLIIGVQVTIWMATGLYMVIVDLDFIHGDPLVKNMRQAVVVPMSPRVSVAALRAQYPDAISIALRPVMGKTFYAVTTPDHRHLIDPETAEVVSPLGEEDAKAIAIYHFDGQDEIHTVSLIRSDPPTEIGSRRLPLWRIDFDDRFSTSFYVDPQTGALVTRRHRYWRIFDFAFMLHIMDYDERTDVHNWLLRTAQAMGLVFALTGIWLLTYSFTKGPKKKAAVD